MIKENLTAMCKDLKASRAIVARIHGTETSKGTLSTDSVFSIVFEHCVDNVDTVKPLVQNVPISVLQLEFGENTDGIVVADIDYAENKKCTAHLEKLGAVVIINQLLKIENYIWGILSLQFLERPSFIVEGEVTSDFIPLLENYKQSILITNHENK